MKTRNQILQLAAIAGLAIPANAAVVVTPDHIQGTPTYTVQGTLAAVDAPTTQGSNFSGPQGPDWPVDADDGFTMDSGYSIGPDAGGRPGWEPDGTVAGSAPTGFTFSTADGKQVSWTFDLPDGSIVHNVYSHWFHQANSGSQSTLGYDEGTPTTIVRPARNSINNLQLQWTDSAAGEHNINFERVFAGDIGVTGGDGFAVTFTVDPNSLEGGVFPYIDAVVIDYTLPSAGNPAISTLNPADGASGVPVCSDLVANFDKVVVLTGTGTVTLRHLGPGPGSDVTINLPSDANGVASTSGLELTINPAADLDLGTNYAVQISAAAIEDAGGNPFAGILNDTTWSFTTSTPITGGGVEVLPGKVVTGSITGSGLIIDTPNGFPGATPPPGIDWPEDADDGWAHVSGTVTNETTNKPGWEPDGTSNSNNIQRFNNGTNTWTFDLPDGAVINAVYASWGSQGNTPGADYSYSEGAASDTVSKSHTSGASGDLVLSWTDDLAVDRNVNFESLFAGPITVAGGDGFTVTTVGNGLFGTDAIVVDVAPVATITSFEGAGATGVIDQTAKTIALEVPFGADLANLAPTFTLSSGICDQPSSALPSPTFADAPGNTVDYVVTDTSTDPDTVNPYSVTVTVAPQVGTLVIDLGSTPGTKIEGGTFGTYVAAAGFPTNLPLPSLPAGSILQSIAVAIDLESTDNENFTNDLAVLVDPTPGTPGGDFSLGIVSPDANVDFGLGETLTWVGGGDENLLTETKTDADWTGDIDLATNGLFLGNGFQRDGWASPEGGTWSGTITLTYLVGSGGGNDFSDWIAGFRVGGQTAIDDDPDGDGNDNGVENFFGTAPDAFTQGLVSGTVDTGANTFTFTHPLNATPADDLTAVYRWSTDLQTFYDDGDPNGAGTTTVDFSQGTPSGGMVTVTATISGTVIPAKLFVDVEVTQN